MTLPAAARLATDDPAQGRTLPAPNPRGDHAGGGGEADLRPYLPRPLVACVALILASPGLIVVVAGAVLVVLGGAAALLGLVPLLPWLRPQSRPQSRTEPPAQEWDEPQPRRVSTWPPPANSAAKQVEN